MKRVVILALFLTLIQASLPAQDNFYSTRNFTAIDGLPQSQVRALVEDKSGYLWIGTEGGGLARFDGREFKVYTTMDGLLSNQVIGLKFDTNDNLWILHPRGVTRFNGLSFKKFQNPPSQTLNKHVRRMYFLKDTLFVLSNAGLTSKFFQDSVYYWEREQFAGKQIWNAHVAPGGEVILFMVDGTFAIRREENAELVHPGADIGKIYTVFNYNQDVILQSMKGTFRLDTKSKRIEPFELELTHSVMLYDPKDDKLWSTDGNTLYKESIKNKVLKSDTILNDISINQVLVDSEGNTWFASNGNGLYKYSIQDFMRCSSDNMRGVMTIHKDHRGASWIGTMNRGLWRMHKGKTKSFFDEKELFRNSIFMVAESPDSTIWVGTGYGLGKYLPEKDNFEWFSREDGLPGFSVLNMAFDEQGGMWIGTGNGLSYYDGATFRNYSTDDGLAVNGVMALHYSNYDKTVYIGNDIAINTVKDEKIASITIPEIVNTTVISIHSYQDSLLLVGTGGTGVMLLNPKTKHRKFITTKDGLASDFVYFATEDEKGYLWIGTEKGINHVKLDKRHDVVENLHFDYDSGLKGVETNQNSFYLTADEKYFGLVDGLYEYNDLNKQRLRSFDVHLSDVQILYGEYSLRAYSDSTFGFFKIPYKPVLPPDRNHLTFHFNRVDKRYPKSVKYRYYLENFDKTWSQPSSVNSVTYSNLPPGNYILRVMSTNNRGSWSDTKIAYEFTVRAPFYQTASFIVGAFILVAGLITLILYIRVKQRVNRIVMLERIRQKEQDNLRKEIARDFHDEMGNQLTRIINYVSLLKLNSGHSNGNGNGYSNSGNGHDLYTKVEDSAKYLYSGTRDFIWSIDPVNDELSKLFLHIRDFGEKLFEEKGISFRAFNEVREKIKLPYGFSREANLIFKEAMTNAFKSSEAKNVSLVLKRDENNGFEMSLEDDGIGFIADDLEKSNGLQNIRERANRINGLLRIHSEKTKGTKITLNFTLTKTLKYGLTL